jgi:hypothetical protein
MRKAAHEYADLVLRTLPSGQLVTIRADQEALEELGLTRHYDYLKDHLVAQHGVAGYGYSARSVSRRKQGSHRHARLIINLPEGSAQKTRVIRFQLSSKLAQFDLVELAHFIEVDWHYLVSADGKRRPREWWKAAYEKGPHGEKAAA